MASFECFRRVALLAAVTMVALSHAALRADSAEPLRWKFEVGDKLDYNMVQDMNLTMTGQQIGEIGTTMHQEMQMTWDVQGVNAEGEAVIRQTFDRVRMKMTAPGGQGFEYDTDSDQAPAGMAAMIAPMFEAMTKGEFEITMTPRGEIKEVKIPDAVIEALRGSPAAATMGDMATAEGFQKMLMQGAMVLPEDAPEQGQQWSTKMEVNNPMAGKQTVETTYTYDGSKEVEGTTYAVFRPTLKMDFEGNQMMQTKVTGQDSEGEVLFNKEEGRLHSSKLKQNVAMDITIAGQTMQQKIEQTIDVTVKPAEGEAATSPAQPSTNTPAPAAN